MRGGTVREPIVSGKADLAVATMPLIVEERRVQMVGPIPSELQNYIVFTAGVGSVAKEANAATALIKLLMRQRQGASYRSTVLILSRRRGSMR
jgi:molybdate transport system substrate-binding protein